MRIVIREKIQQNSEGAFTLLELIIATVLVSTISLAIYSIVEFSRYHVGNADLRARIQNNASYIADHMSRNISRAIGATALGAGEMPADNTAIGGNRAIMYWIDTNPINGQRDNSDARQAYRWYGIAGGNAYELRFCPDCANADCSNCNPNWNATEVVGTNVEYWGCFNPPGPAGAVILNGNSVEVQTQVRNTAGAAITVDNPEVTMRIRIKLPAVSTR
jgi:type II secretory pathway pseudopilin PulG